MLRSLLIAAVLVSTLGVSACNSGNKEQQPTADEQKRIQDEQQKAIGATKATYIRLGEFYEPCRAQYRIRARENKEAAGTAIQSSTQKQQQQPSNHPQQ